MGKPVRVTSFIDFERKFGRLDSRSEAGYAIQQYYLNGGQVAFVIRVAEGTPLPAIVNLITADSAPSLALEVQAASEGLWGKNIQVAIGYINNDPNHFNLVVREVDTINGRKQVINSEIYRNLSMVQNDARYVKALINDQSQLIMIGQIGAGGLPAETGIDENGKRIDITSEVVATNTNPDSHIYKKVFRQLGSDITLPAASDGIPPTTALVLINGMRTLDGVTPEIFNILCIPDAAKLIDDQNYRSLYAAAIAYCRDKRAFLIIDIPESVKTQQQMSNWMTSTGDNLRHENAAIYFPRLLIPDERADGRLRNFGPSGTIAGIFARTDTDRGVWKAPAGVEATLLNAQVETKLTDLENGAFNPFGVNILRTFPVYGNVCWGGRTLNGADQMANEWKYIPVRRTALFIEESLYQGLKWVVFEPNDAPLWGIIRLNVDSFMNTLFRQGAFQGSSPREAYLVKCDSDTTTQADIDNGIVHVLVGFAPLKPAEFVVIQLQLLAGQTAT
jgi:hypothetical protein